MTVSVKRSLCDNCIHRDICGYDFTNSDSPTLIVGTQKNGKMEIVNAFQGPNALRIYHELIAKEETVK